MINNYLVPLQQKLEALENLNHTKEKESSSLEKKLEEKLVNQQVKNNR